MWLVIFSPEFGDWFTVLEDDEKESILRMVAVLELQGHLLGRPYVDSIKGSSLANLKELRIQHRGQPYRAFFVFDRLRQAVVLCAGNKRGDKRFYARMIPLAESIYQRYLEQQSDE